MQNVYTANSKVRTTNYCYECEKKREKNKKKYYFLHTIFSRFSFLYLHLIRKCLTILQIFSLNSFQIVFFCQSNDFQREKKIMILF